MRILHVVPSYLPAVRYGGPIFSVHGLCKGLVRLGHEVHVFTTNVDGQGNSDVPLGLPVELDGVTVWYFPSAHLRRFYWAPSMWSALKTQVPRFDLLHLHSIYLWPTWAAARAARASSVPYVIAPRGMLVRELIERKSRWAKEAWIQLVERRNLERAAAIHVTSERERRDVAAFGFALPHIWVVPNGIDVPPSADLPGSVSISPSAEPSESAYILYLGRINWKKGLDRLIPAMRHVPAMRLVVAGNDEENYLPALERLAREQGVRERIDFIGPVSGARKAELLRDAAVLALPSYSENFGIVVLEAMAAGCPVAVTEEVGAAEIVVEAGGGVVLPGVPDKLGAGLANLLNDPRLREMGERGREFVSKRYTWDVIGKQMETLYEQILTRKER